MEKTCPRLVPITYDVQENLKSIIENGTKCEIVQTLGCIIDPDLKFITSAGNTVIHLLLMNAKLNEDEIRRLIVIFLDLDKGIDLNKPNNTGNMPIFYAIIKRMKSVVKLLLKKNAKIGRVDRLGNTVIHLFIENEYLEYKAKFDASEPQLKIIQDMENVSLSFVEFMLKRGFDFDRGNFFKQTAVRRAVHRNLSYILPLLFENTRCIDFLNESKQSWLHMYFIHSKTRFTLEETWYSAHLRFHDARTVSVLLNRKLSVEDKDIDGRTPLQLAVEYNQGVEVIRMLLDRVSDINHRDRKGNTVFNDAIGAFNFARRETSNPRINNHLEILQALVDNGCDVNNKNNKGLTPIKEAIAWGNLPAVEFLKRNGADFYVERFGSDNLLFYLTKEGRSETVDAELFDILVSAGCSIKAVTDGDSTLLHMAARNGKLTIVQKLLSKGLDINERTPTCGYTPLFLASRPCASIHKHGYEMVKLLVSNGANVKVKDSLGKSPLHLASMWPDVDNGGKPSVMEMYLQRFADVNARDNTGETALHNAIRSHAAKVDVLLKYGAEINDPTILRLPEESAAFKKIASHWIKLKAAQLPCIETFGSRFLKDGFLEFHNECREEVTKLKSHLFSGRRSLYDLLHGDPREQCRDWRTRQLLELVERPRKLEAQFPNYAVLILGSYHRAVARKDMQARAMEAWLTLTEIYIPALCIEHIISFMDNEDLMLMLDE